MNASLKSHTSALVKQIRFEDQDYEFYPTTGEILAVIKRDIDKMVRGRFVEENPSILDCGAGDGRSLVYLTSGKRYAIEKSRPLITAMDRSIFVIGADFNEQILIDKSVSITFSNPPYSEYVSWCEKIVTESKSAYLYLVIPQRWKSNREIESAIALRDGTTEVIGSFDFLEADRKARAVVDVVKVTLTYGRANHSASSSKTDPFVLWFNQNFNIKAAIDKPSGLNTNTTQIKETVSTELVAGGDLVAVLVKLYNRDMDKLMSNYRRIEGLDYDLLSELGVSLRDLKGGLLLKISGLKNLYWKELFDGLNKVTDKLVKDSREKLLAKLTAHTDIDFNASNVYAVVIWVVKSSNFYFDDQLVNLVDSMIQKANIVLYKSNQRTFRDSDWRYCSRPDGLERYFIDYRVVLERVGGLSTSDFNHDRNRYNGLTERAYFYLMDIITVANNLGFDTANRTRPSEFDWYSSGAKTFYYYDHRKGVEAVLFTAKAFLNGNLHIKFNQAFMMMMNVEHGRLKGWIKSGAEASQELDISAKDAENFFKSNLQLTASNYMRLGVDLAA